MTSSGRGRQVRWGARRVRGPPHTFLEVPPFRYSRHDAGCHDASRARFAYLHSRLPTTRRIPARRVRMAMTRRRRDGSVWRRLAVAKATRASPPAFVGRVIGSPATPDFARRVPSPGLTRCWIALPSSVGIISGFDSVPSDFPRFPLACPPRIFADMRSSPARPPVLFRPRDRTPLRAYVRVCGGRYESAPGVPGCASSDTLARWQRLFRSPEHRCG
jgi:hypothetical protein